ncbi:peptidyl-prolyl cis-trans isomerase D [Planococcus citri]|uniref:peptidyl-prolyl cis-trans isomerase D n=1 Tax=Planococcus citri TaxID=170843 RepID=UPI0031F83965
MTNTQKEEQSLVYLDFSEDGEFIGRVVIKLFKDIVPRSAENFRALCTGEKGIGKLGKPLHYKNSIIHKVMPKFMIQGGDITDFNGSGGESIYGPFFDDENFTIKHSEPGMVSMVNAGKPNTNNSQFFITVVESEHLNSQNVVIGKVVKGYQVVEYISETKAEDYRPIHKYVISDCGEMPEEDLHVTNHYDGTTDIYPLWPQDWDIDKDNLDKTRLLQVLTDIRNSGNEFFKKKSFSLAGVKYRKALEYMKCFKSVVDQDTDAFSSIKLICLLNSSAVKLKMKDYKACIDICDEVLKCDENNAKAIYRKGKANVALNNHDLGLQYLKQARRLEPYNKDIINEIREVKRFMSEYLIIEKQLFAKMLKK